MVHGPASVDPGHRRRPGRGRSHRPQARRRDPGRAARWTRATPPPPSWRRRRACTPARRSRCCPSPSAGLQRGHPDLHPRNRRPGSRPLPGLRRPLQPVRDRLPEPGQPRLPHGALPAGTARAGAARRPAGAGRHPARSRCDQTVQTLNIADFCNECGNCATFCPTAGAPYQDKPRFWIDQAGLPGGQGRRLPHGARPATAWSSRPAWAARSTGWRSGPQETLYRGGQVSARFRTGSWELLGWAARGALAEGSTRWISPPAPPCWSCSMPSRSFRTWSEPPCKKFSASVNFFVDCRVVYPRLK